MSALPAIVYALCFLTSAACAILLFRNYKKTKLRLLLWGAFSFSFLAANNLAVITDLLILPHSDYAVPRLVLSVMAAGILLYGFIWEGDN